MEEADYWQFPTGVYFNPAVAASTFGYTLTCAVHCQCCHSNAKVKLVTICSGLLLNYYSKRTHARNVQRAMCIEHTWRKDIHSTIPDVLSSKHPTDISDNVSTTKQQLHQTKREQDTSRRYDTVHSYKK